MSRAALRVPRRAGTVALRAVRVAMGVFLLLAGGGAAAARAPDGRTTLALERACQAENGEAGSWCAAYLMGVADTLTAFGKGGHRGGLCNPNYDPETLARAFVAWAQRHSELRNLDMLAGATAALRERWPCA
ncbi:MULTISPECIES: Rap1a/Tai family immunity protein [Roseicella]|uniref:Rap1a immunity protein domain-containing protein n=2 Tax=Roseicella TaxID=2730923 RepID=A0A9X1IGS8_9PROT|nr:MULTISPECIES: Rap1a/Tai family immunity protein [Roseicella]MCB4824207.1 hypothetical protein [Roseicella aerolata]RAI56066.1 hypothetical protein DOO78_22765 [Roseicella frigidaeris]